MSDSLSSADRDARIAEIEQRTLDVSVASEDEFRDNAIWLCDDQLPWLIAELRAALSREEEARTVYVVMGAMGTCPSDSMDWLVSVFASREAAEAFIATMPEPVDGGPWYTIEEKTVARSVSLSENG